MQSWRLLVIPSSGVSRKFVSAFPLASQVLNPYTGCKLAVIDVPKTVRPSGSSRKLVPVQEPADASLSQTRVPLESYDIAWIWLLWGKAVPTNKSNPPVEFGAAASIDPLGVIMDCACNVGDNFTATRPLYQTT